MKKILFTLFILLAIYSQSYCQSLDSTFGIGGVASLTSLGFNVDARNASKALQTDGKILLAGSKNNDFAIARINVDGSLDGTFGAGGIVTIDLGGKTDYGQGIAIQPDGKIVMVGYQFDSYQTNCHLVYYGCGWNGTCSYTQCDTYYGYDYGIIRLNSNGTLDNSFANGGKLIISHLAYYTSGTQEILNAVAIKGDGQIVAAGYENNQLILFRFNPNGTFDNTFNSGYQLYSSPNFIPNSLIVKPDGKILINTNSNLVQVNDNSSLDASFGTNGIVAIANTTTQDAKINSNGNVLIAGYRYTQSPQSYLWVVQQYTNIGTLDNSFGSAGETIIDFNNVFNNFQEELAYSLAIDSLNNIYVGGEVYYPNSTFQDLAVAKLKPVGSLDSTFGKNGKFRDSLVTADYYGVMLLQADNKILSFSNAQNTIERFNNPQISLVCHADTIITSTIPCGVIVNNIDPVINPNGSVAVINYKLQKAGITLETGTGSVSGKAFGKGVTTVIYTLANDTSRNCSFTVTVNTPTPTISIHIDSATICSSDTATFTATVNNIGINPVYYWRKNGIVFESGSSNSFEVVNLQTGDSITCDVSSIICSTLQSVSSNIITITVNPASTYYRDADSDGYGNLAIPKSACTLPSGYVTNNSDCNDNDSTIHPGAMEVYDGKDNNCNGQVDEGVAPPNILPVVTITSPANNSSYAAGTPITLNANATDADGSITKVEFFNNGVKFLEDSTSAYGLVSSEAEPGSYVLTAKATDNKGAVKVSDTVRLTITSCTGAGTIYGEGFTSIPGTQVANLTSSPSYPNSPSIAAQLGSIEYSGVGDNYGARLRGYICAPQTGNYTFYIAGDDQAGIFLSTDDNPANKVLLAYNLTPVGFRAWTTFATQKSAPVRLIKGVRYYIETLHKQSTGTNHLSVAWVLPDGSNEAPIPGNRLTPYTTIPGSGTRAADFTQLMQLRNVGSDISKALKVTATPNPATNYFTLVTSSGNDQLISVNVTDVIGRMVERKSGITANGTLRIGNKLTAGVYFVEVIQGTQKVMMKLMKK